MSEAAPGGRRVTLLTDPGWPPEAAVLAWRAELRAAVLAAGAIVAEVGAELPGGHPAAPAGSSSPASPAAARDASSPVAGTRSPRVIAGRRVPTPVRRVLGRAARRLRRGRRPAPPPRSRQTSVATPAATAFAPVSGDPVATGPLGADVVIAETPGVAAALAGQVPVAHLWCLALPPERTVWGEPLPSWAAPLHALADRVAGFVTDSDEARDIIERALSDRRVAVVVLPPLAVAPGALLGAVTVRPRDTAAPAWGQPDEHAEPAGPVEQLRTWAALRSGEEQTVRPELAWAARRPAGDPPGPAPESSAWSAEVDLAPGAWPGPDPVPVQRLGAAGLDAQRQRDGVAALLARSGPRDRAAGAVPLKVGVLGHDLKFVRELAEALDRRSDLVLDLDEWPGPGRRNGARTDAVAREADVLVAEWARPNAVWLSRNKRPDQRLVVRLHRFELTSPYPADIDIDRVDAVVHIAPVFGPRIRDELGWPAEKLVYLPNYLDVGWLDRPKREGARFTLALVGATFAIKRLDLALDLLARVRREDPRFSLLVRTGMPWEVASGWAKEPERRFFALCAERIETDPLLRGAVRFDPFGRDVAAWFRQAGHVLSLSDNEGSHAALAEGMASGAVPVVRGWHGVEHLYGSGWVRPDPEDAARFVLESADPQVWAERSTRAHAHVAREFDPARVLSAWHDLLRGDVPAAAAHFAGRALVGPSGSA